MYIKQLIIEGFKSFKERTVIDPFDPEWNCILGKNGSGKSNLLAAIEFVLSDKYSSLRVEERSKLLYEGSGREILSATVEVIFDNSDSRFPIDKTEISIKRTIGLKKDEFFLNDTHMAKQDISNLLESAGLSRTNPYYIVQQGTAQFDNYFLFAQRNSINLANISAFFSVLCIAVRPNQQDDSHARCGAAGAAEGDRRDSHL
jgi:structural maintenance of chromosome 3 (chondroitin sulfate proteoglycan 6)